MRVFLFLAVVAAIGAAAYCQQPSDTPLSDAVAERYFPDPAFPQPDETRAPYPDDVHRSRTIEAERIVLRGRDVTIELSASGRWEQATEPDGYRWVSRRRWVAPGITMAHRNGNIQKIYFTAEGEPVIGLGERGRGEWSAALVVGAKTRNGGRVDGAVLQLRDSRGTYVLAPGEIYNRGAR